MSKSSKAVVIGAGIAGIATAIRLAVQGWRVEVFEKNSYPGGKLSWFEQDGYSFDAGPSLFTQPHHIAALFELARVPMEEFFQYERVPVACRYFFANGKKVTAWADRQQFALEMQEQLGEPADNVLRYLQQSGKAYNHIGSLFVNQSLHRWRDFNWKSVPAALRHTRPAYLFSSLNRYNESAFTTPEAAQLFNRYATYNGSNPFKAPAMLSLIPSLEMNEGTFYPKGGMISITNALHRLAEKLGVTFHFDTPVQQIIQNDGRVKGVVAYRVNIDADIVVSNSDAYFTYLHLLNDAYTARKILKQERSSSALIFYWGIGREVPAFHLHNILFTADYRREFDHLFHKGSLYHDPTVYVNITSKMEAMHAPAGKENWFVMVNAPANHGQPWESWIPGARRGILNRLKQTLGADIEKYIETEAILDPRTIESRTSSYMGSLYGTSSNSRLAAFLRHPNFSRPIRGLYFVGGSVHPGGGIPLCLNSAAITAALVEKNHRKAGVA